MMSCQQFQ